MYVVVIERYLYIYGKFGGGDWDNYNVVSIIFYRQMVFFREIGYVV